MLSFSNTYIQSRYRGRCYNPDFPDILKVFASNNQSFSQRTQNEMTAERWNKIKALFSSAQDCAVGERDNFLNRACGTDRGLRSEVEKLLDSYDEDDAFLQNSAVAEAASIFDGDGKVGIDFTSSDPESPRFEAGAVINERYEIVRLLGRGGMGEVYFANDRRIKRTVALKVLHSSQVSSKESLRRFALEAQAVSALNHPHIMTIYEFDAAGDGTLFFVAEYVNGLTLNHYDKLDLDRALEIAMQIASALSAAHEAGIIHRDIKPENIMVRPDGYIKVLDFGLAKLNRNEIPSIDSYSEDTTRALMETKPGAVMGTAAYMSPEQARGLPVDARTDVWSLGAVMYEMLTGKRAFWGDTQADLMVALLSHEPQPMSSHVPGLPVELEWIVLKALSKNVEGRYQTAKELRADLDKIKKRVEFEKTLNHSADGVYGSFRSNENIVNTSDERTTPTAVGPARPTSDGQGESSAPRSFWSSPSFTGVLQQAHTHKLRSTVAALILAVLVSSGLYFGFLAPRSSARIDSIAVLPFQNLSGNSDLTYFSDGVSESLIDRLSQLSQMKVISSNSSFKFRGNNIDVRDAASQMGVRAVITGSVNKIEDDLVIRFEIIDASEDRHLTGGQFRRKAGDIVNLPGEIARAAADQMRLKLTESQTRRFVDSGTEDSEAFRYYLSGLVELNSRRDVRSRALEYFEQAIKLDPDFAYAHAEIAWIYISRANSSGDPNELIPKAKAATELALELNPNLAKARVVQAMLHEYRFDWRAAETDYRRAIELNPNLDFARNNYAFFLSVMNRQDEALAELEQQRLRDPINRRLALLQKGIILTQARKFDEALSVYQEAQAVEPADEIPLFSLGYAYAGKGLYKEAAGIYRKAVDVFGGEEKYSQPLVYLAAAYARMPEKRSEARAILKRIEATKQYVSPALLAAVYCSLDENEKAIEQLEQAYIRRDLLLRFIGTGYEYDGLRSDPRFADLKMRIGLGQ